MGALRYTCYSDKALCTFGVIFQPMNAQPSGDGKLPIPGTSAPNADVSAGRVITVAQLEPEPTETTSQADEQMASLQRLLASQNRPEEDLQNVRRAYWFAVKAHTGQKRKAGDEYITHPVAVAHLLAEIPVDTPTVMAALLHDVLEDTPATPEQLTKHFGAEVLALVEGVTKLGKLEFSTQEERQAENFRKMFLAMATDVRVILLKLGDRLHNMRTLDHMPPHKQARIAKETLDIFAPLANRLGMGNLRAELEDLSFKAMDPERYNEIERAIAATRKSRERVLTQVTEKIDAQLRLLGIEPKIYARLKNLYSIDKKMRARSKKLEDVYDISALRIVVDTEKECYEALGVVHQAYTPLPGRFKDYIAMPRNNFYQSLHTTVIGPANRPLEIQIRTHAMHTVAEYGIAAHWRYKEAGSSVSAESLEERKLSWLKQIMEMKDQADDARAFVDSVRLDLFRDQVFVFTPKGEVIDLPRGSTPIDFAYRIHTEIGHTCTGAMVNHRIVTLDYELENGDMIEILTNRKATPKLDWMKFVATQTAKGRIRQWFKRNLREEHVTQGKAALEAVLTRAEVDKAIRSGALAEVGKSLNMATVEDLFAELGYGEINLPRVVNRLRKHQQTQQQAADTNQQQQAMATMPDTLTPAASPAPSSLPVLRRSRIRRRSGKDDAIQGLEGMLYHLAKCCMPVPGDEIEGVVTRSRGVMVHRANCPNLAQVNPERLMPVRWHSGGDEEAETAKRRPAQERAHRVRLHIITIDRVGMFKDVLSQIADTHTNVVTAGGKMHGDGTATIDVTLEVRHMSHLEQVQHAISRLSDVMGVKRV